MRRHHYRILRAAVYVAALLDVYKRQKNGFALRKIWLSESEKR